MSLSGLFGKGSISAHPAIRPSGSSLPFKGTRIWLENEDNFRFGDGGNHRNHRNHRSLSCGDSLSAHSRVPVSIKDDRVGGENPPVALSMDGAIILSKLPAFPLNHDLDVGEFPSSLASRDFSMRGGEDAWSLTDAL